MEAFAWPLAVVVIVVAFMLLYHSPVGDMVRKVHHINWKEGIVVFRTNEIDQTLQGMLNELQESTKNIGEDEVLKLKEIMSRPSGTYTVQQLFPIFSHDDNNPALKTLRKLRDAQFIRPQDGGQWQKEKLIEIKPFGALIWRRLSDKLFNDTETA